MERTYQTRCAAINNPTAVTTTTPTTTTPTTTTPTTSAATLAASVTDMFGASVAVAAEVIDDDLQYEVTHL